MEKIAKSTFRRNLLIGFGISLLILIGSSVISFISIRSLLSGADWVNHTNVVLTGIESIHSNLMDAETNQRGYLLTKEPVFLEEYENAYAETLNALRTVQQMTVDNPAQQANSVKLKEVIDLRIGILQQMIEVRKRDEPLPHDGLRSGQTAMKNVDALIDQMKNEEQRLLVTRTETLTKFAQATPLFIIVGAIIAIIITVTFYFQISNDFAKRVVLQRELELKDQDITRRIAVVEDIATKISAGNYAIRVDDKQRDSLGGVAVSLNAMAQSLEYSFSLLSDKEWMQTGVAALNDLMIGEKSMSELAGSVIACVTEYTRCQAGAFYVLESGVLKRYGGYAIAFDERRQRIELGEGIAGQSALGRKEILLENISSEDISISYALGELRPRNIVAIPIFSGVELKGVIEMASISNFDMRDMEFMKTVSQNIGIAVSTAQNQRRLKELLDETQSQSEELQAQHNELENMNSELEVQTEKLQASEEELKVQQEELLQANQEMEERTKLVEEKNILITERNAEIQQKAEALAESTRYKSEFLANMSHELRTPLNSILLLSRLMSENDAGNLSDDQVEYAKVIQSSGNGLLSLIDEILDLSKIEAGKMLLEYNEVSVEEITREMNAMFGPVAKDKGIAFITNISAMMPKNIETDKLRLEQIIRNLISNALKFTQQGSVTMEFSVSATNRSVYVISIKDTGIGIPQDKQQMIFEAFQQADGSTRRQFGGTGLGLSISRELAKLLGGEIRLKSEPGKGSEFLVYLPIVQPLDEIDAMQQEDDHEPDIAEQAPAPLTRFLSETIPPNIPDDRDAIVKGDKIILIIEDDTNFAKSLLDYTRKQGYKGIVAVRGDEGIKLATLYSPLGILLDIQLPIKNGWEVMADLKGNTATRHIPVHIMSSHSVRNESLLKGAVDFINKPVAYEKMNEIFEKIEYVLNHHPKKVLIVEENAKHAKALAYFLGTFDVGIEIKNSVSEGILALKSDSADCVILDMGIPDQRAYDTLEEVKKTPGLENIPIIIFTGKSLSRAEELKIRQYADSIVVKTAHSYQRIVDEVGLFLHLMEKNKPENVSKSNKLGALTEVLKNKTVLIVDDDVRNIFSMTKSLENYKMKVVTAVDGKEAIRQLHEHPGVDIVLMDMMMPEMDGYETTSLLRKDPKYKKLPIIAVTAKAMMGDRAKCINAGASDYITKPVDADQLLSLLRVWLYEG